MQILNINGEMIKCEFTWNSLITLEMAYQGQGYIETLNSNTPHMQSLLLFWSMLMNDERYENTTLTQSSKMVSKAIEDGAIDALGFHNAMMKEHDEAKVVKQLFKGQNLPSYSEGQERAFDTKRGGIYGVVRGIVYKLERFLVKHAQTLQLNAEGQVSENAERSSVGYDCW